MGNNSKSVALLAREGAARDHLREALKGAGANIVLEGDPTALEIEAVRRVAPQVLLIALEPAIEEALDKLAPLLEDPSLDVIFDEAELAARRNGWEAQRWVRHLTAKLRNSDNVLPSREGSDDSDRGTVSAASVQPTVTREASSPPVAAPAQPAMVRETQPPPAAVPVQPAVPREASPPPVAASAQPAMVREAPPPPAAVPVQPAVPREAPPPPAAVPVQSAVPREAPLPPVAAPAQPVVVREAPPPPAAIPAQPAVPREAPPPPVAAPVQPVVVREAPPPPAAAPVQPTVTRPPPPLVPSEALKTAVPPSMPESATTVPAAQTATHSPMAWDVEGLDVSESVDLGDVTEIVMSDGPSGPADESDSGLSVEEYDSFPEAPPTAFEPVIADKAPEEPKTVYRPAENVPTMESVVDDLVFPPPLPPKRPSDFETGYAAARAPGTVTEETDRHAPESDDGLLTLEEIFRKSARTEPASTSSSFGNLELAPMAPPSESKSKPWDGDSRPVEDEPKYGAPPLPSQQAPTVVAPAISFADLKLVDIEETRSRHNNGAVLVLAGIGGPDAVRKLLADLPQGFSRPVLVQLRLDGGRYDNLVRQISRVSSQPVRLAEADEELESSIIYVLPDHIGLHLKHGILSFISTDQQDEIIDALPPAESAVLFLSGSDPKRVEAALMFAGQGGLVGGQSLEGCYDATAVRLLAGNGIELNTPSQLVTRLVERWGMS